MRRQPPELHRRRLLQALGLLGGASVLPWGRAGGAAPAVPKKIVIVVTSHGTVHEDWRMTGGGPAEGDLVFDLPSLPVAELSPILAPLAGHRDQMMVLEGIGNACAPTAGFLAHPAGNASCLTGDVPTEVPGAYPRCDGPSLDQVIAADQQTVFPSLEWAVGGAPVAYDALGQPLPYETDPVAAWNRLFPTAATTPEATAIRARQTAVLELATSRYEALVPRLAAEEQARLAQHRDLIHDLEARIVALDRLACEAPPEPTGAMPLPHEAAHPGAMVGLFGDLAVAALSCGMTRVVTLRVDAIPTATVGAPPGDLHNDIAHAVAGNPDARAWMTLHHTFLAEQIAELADKLRGAPDEAGGSLLDSTLVVWWNEMATGDHLFHNVPAVLLGGIDGLRWGTYHRWAPRVRVSGRNGVEVMGQVHNKLLTTIGSVMGLPGSSFGVTELAGPDGPVDCTGTLPGVLT
jgi:hypothetical protein